MQRTPGIFICAVLLLASCDSITGPADDLQVATSRTGYAIEGTNAVVEFTVRNVGDHVLYVTRCGERISPYLDRRHGSGWQEYGGAACPAVYSMVPLELRPGEEGQGTLGVRDAGRYRIRVGVSRDRRNTIWTAASNSFDVTR